MAFVELYILNAQYVAAGVPIRIYGYPWPTEQVTTESCLARFPTWTLDNPDCYFVNYDQLLITSIAASFIGLILFRYSKQEIPMPKGNPVNGKAESPTGQR